MSNIIKAWKDTIAYLMGVNKKEEKDLSKLEIQDDLGVLPEENQEKETNKEVSKNERGNAYNG